MPMKGGAAMSDLREAVRSGTLQRMQRALADVDARLEELRAERDRLAASIAEVEGRPPSRREQAHSEELYRPDPAEATPAYRDA
jgi:septal ring factor EnvC (AmiA/AmiB activator)